jgi:hypothetical protein
MHISLNEEILIDLLFRTIEKWVVFSLLKLLVSIFFFPLIRIFQHTRLVVYLKRHFLLFSVLGAFLPDSVTTFIEIFAIFFVSWSDYAIGMFLLRIIKVTIFSLLLKNSESLSLSFLSY